MEVIFWKFCGSIAGSKRVSSIFKKCCPNPAIISLRGVNGSVVNEKGEKLFDAKAKKAIRKEDRRITS
jgi:hypothetical protein